MARIARARRAHTSPYIVRHGETTFNVKNQHNPHSTIVIFLKADAPSTVKRSDDFYRPRGCSRSDSRAIQLKITLSGAGYRGIAARERFDGIDSSAARSNLTLSAPLSLVAT
jgi:hypothetical protein